MAVKKLNMGSIFIFLFLVFFPFGQALSFGFVKPIDIVAGFGALYALLAHIRPPAEFKYLIGFFAVAVFSWIFSVFYFRDLSVLFGLLYLVRLGAYLYFFVYVYDFVKKNNAKDFLVNSLILVSSVAAVIGWLQFFIFPDLKPLFIWGWDMHLYRLVGLFLDATYLGIIIVLGILAAFIRMVEVKNGKHTLIAIFLVISLAFTYSRASFLALFAGLLVIGLYRGKLKKILLFAIIFLTLVLLLPTVKNQSINLFRSFSAIARIENYKNTLQIFEKSPVIGIGYNNMCLAYNKYVGYQKFTSHACSGSDSSILFVLATTGVTGLIVFVYMWIMILSNLKIDKSESLLLLSSVSAVLTHSFFSNAMFYPWVAGWMATLLALALVTR